jgi:hypothetical protein
MTASPNVGALEAMMPDFEQYIASVPWITGRQMAEWLASRGVLATEALTDEQCEEAWSGGTEYDYDYGKQLVPAEFRAALARLARGEG